MVEDLFFKVCATVLPENYDWTKDKAIEIDELTNDMERIETSSTSSKRSTYSEGGSLKKGKLTGVKRLILLAIVPDIKETHNNVSIIFDLIRLNNISFKIVTDFKLQLIILGLQTATAMHPCGYCLISKNQLQNRMIEAVGERTFGNLDKDHQKFVDNKCIRKDARYYNNCINPCLLKEDPSTPVLEKYIVPELHLILGFVDHVFSGVKKLVGIERASLWPSREHLVVKGYQGGTLEGNACNALLKLGNKLLDDEILGDVPQSKMLPYVNAINCMNKLVNACFSTKLVNGSIDKLVNELGKAIIDTDLTITLKLHVLLCHLIPTLKLPYFKGYGLGVCSEQSGKSIHSYFKDHFWEKLKRSDIAHPQYITNF